MIKYIVIFLALFILNGCSNKDVIKSTSKPIAKEVIIETSATADPKPEVAYSRIVINPDYKEKIIPGLSGNHKKYKFMIVDDKTPLTKTRDFLYNKSSPKLPVYGMIIFTSKPVTDEQKKQYKLICNIWEASFITNDEVSKIEPNVDRFITYWPTTNTDKNKSSSCNNLHNYDYITSQAIINKLGISKPGPMLIAIYKNKNVKLNLDLLSDKDIIRAFNIWKFELVVTKNGWNKSFNITYFKEKFKNLLDVYGQALLEFKKG